MWNPSASATRLRYPDFSTFKTLLFDMSKKARVCFLRSGCSHGYGYSAGEFGVVRAEDLKDSKYKDKSNNERTKPGLLSLGIVRMAGEGEGSEPEARSAKAPRKGKAAVVVGHEEDEDLEPAAD